MDIVAHALWAAAGGRWLEAKAVIDGRTFWGVVALAVAPDVVPMLPVVAHAAVRPNPLQFLIAYVTATPATEPALPALVQAWTHHLHCAVHSIVVLFGLTALLGLVRRRFPCILAGWWLHVLLDVPTHSADYYGVPIFYPLSERTFDGIAWTDPWLLVVNYLLLAAAFIGLYRGRILGA